MTDAQLGVLAVFTGAVLFIVFLGWWTANHQSNYRACLEAGGYPGTGGCNPPVTQAD